MRCYICLKNQTGCQARRVPLCKVCGKTWDVPTQSSTWPAFALTPLEQAKEALREDDRFDERLDSTVEQEELPF